ncbi:shieldin complex subunit 3 [Syngnathoides biaculeatus]|uniref:shieldin complex subunit 3 n=1 Tax=Syngnathoides biaculeatus TaxID=300417 RepID=UPI002ADDCC5B|nr:shieldin complex subunit 3 [Syngnathoides biaculeatus]XP_061673045.1 shieldin complex subunit 3 [Syngnathoides biaculeatus]XP_061673046.1 shieldin complex subunit 3 [Syngnathoides biaculeatus]XP_061673048.1 shieldin complex subunit 3 [Syngnathoides biaculeatus]XP_061673049.1 shieldin complex subunit 3 [Syngnathoides biaculeatus]
MMEDVVVHHCLEGSDGLGDLIAITEKLLLPFACRPPAVFTPWFSSSSARRPPPIRPAKSAPVINAGDFKCLHDASKDGGRIPGTSNCLASDKKSIAVKRSWNVLASKDAYQPSPSLSKRFRHTLSLHALHPLQRSKWVISQHNCGAARDIEKVWEALSRATRGGGLPTCNANIQRERAEIWVFCDVAYSEQVGLFLKRRLQLLGSIRLHVRKFGDILSL